MADICAGNHRKPRPAVAFHLHVPLCRLHLNRRLLEVRILYWWDDQELICPDHPERGLRLSRWNGGSKAFIYCPAPLGEKVFYPASGRGQTRRPSGGGYTSFCEFKVDVPQHVLDGGK